MCAASECSRDKVWVKEAEWVLFTGTSSWVLGTWGSVPHFIIKFLHGFQLVLPVYVQVHMHNTIKLNYLCIWKYIGRCVLPLLQRSSERIPEFSYATALILGLGFSALEKCCPGSSKQWVLPSSCRLQHTPKSWCKEAFHVNSCISQSIYMHMHMLFLGFYHLSIKHEFFSDAKPPYVHIWFAVYLTRSDMGAQIMVSFTG